MASYRVLGNASGPEILAVAVCTVTTRPLSGVDRPLGIEPGGWPGRRARESETAHRSAAPLLLQERRLPVLARRSTAVFTDVLMRSTGVGRRRAAVRRVSAGESAACGGFARGRLVVGAGHLSPPAAGSR
jgi:hypothetical protein